MARAKQRKRSKSSSSSHLGPTLLLAALAATSVAVAVRAALEPGPWQRVLATREGEVGKKTSTGLVIQPESLFVALPHPMALHKHVEIRYGNRTIVAQVLDVGPWNVDDAYWKTSARPASERAHGKYRVPSNHAGIDLSNAVFAALGLSDNDVVDWRFVHKGYLVLPWL
ncbi:MAG: hypothetical protein ABI321_23250 [Polyangia bacterium]